MNDLTRIRRPGPTAFRSGALPSRFERLAEQMQGLELRRHAKLLDVLLASIPSDFQTGAEVLWPLWAQEGMHRAGSMLRLVTRLNRRAGGRSCGHLTRQIDLALANDLAARYHALEAAPERLPAPCSVVLRELARDLASLFGIAVGGVLLRTDIERLALPGYQCRALVLATSELVINALSHAYGPRRDGELLVSLNVVGRTGLLVVEDDGIGCSIDPAEAAHRMAGSLVDLLEGTLLYRPGRYSGTRAEVSFPLR